MSRLKRNLIANFAGSGWLMLSGLIFTPIYIRLMGAESYGLIGFYYTLQAALQVFDFGLSPTINREMARYSTQPGQADEARDFARTFEAGYWVIGLVLGGAVWLAAPLLTTQWLKPDRLDADTVQATVSSMAVLIALQWPLTLYEGGLLGLQQHVALNGLGIVVTTLRTLGAVVFLELTAPTIEHFFLWQIAASLVHVGVITVLFRRSLPPASRRARVDVRLAGRVWKFAAGMTTSTLAWFILSQLDKVILSGLIDLETFGYYILAGLIASGLRAIVGPPLFNVIYPRFSTLMATADVSRLRSVYHFAAQLLAVLICPLAGLLVFYSYPIVLAWLGTAQAAQIIAPLTSVLIIGAALSTLEAVPYALELAHGWTSLGLLINTGSIVLYAPAVLILVNAYGAIGAAISWAALGVIRIVTLVWLTHRRLLKGEAGRWLWADTGLPLLAATALILVSRPIVDGLASIPETIAVLTVVLAAAFLAAALAARDVRGWAAAQVERRWRAATR
jgi:O-antigen/teichoic acid export membrane protein